MGDGAETLPMNINSCNLPVRAIVNGHRIVVGHAKVDSDLYEQLSKYRWSFGGGRSLAYVMTNVQGKKCSLHKMVCMLRGIIIPSGMEIDHIDRDPKNNTSCNIRVVSRSINHANRGVQKNTSSGYKGVSWYNAYKKWASAAKKDGKKAFLGYYIDKTDAAKAVNAFYAKHFPEVVPPNPL